MEEQQKRSALVTQLEGLGNAIMTTPLVQALATLGYKVDVACKLDRGSGIVFGNWPGVCTPIPLSAAPGRSYDVLIKCQRGDLPGLVAPTVITTMPVPTVDFSSWKKHEVLYNLDAAVALGYAGKTPRLRINMTSPIRRRPHHVAVGIGYYKNSKRDWSFKHWGDRNYKELCRMLLKRGHIPVLVGDGRDFEVSGRNIIAPGVQSVCGQPLEAVIEAVANCGCYVGNDSGLMHVAAAVGIPCVVYCNRTSMTKNHPWGVKWVALGPQTVPVRMLMAVLHYTVKGGV